MKRILISIVVALIAATGAAQVRTGQYDDPKSATGTHSDLEVGVGNGEKTTFNKFRKEHWRDINISDPKLIEKKKMLEEVKKKREEHYGSYSSGHRKRPANSKSVGGASKNKGSGYKRRSSGYDRERDEQLKERAMEKAEKDQQVIRDLNAMVQGQIARDANFDTPTDGAAMAKAAKNSCDGMPEGAAGPKTDVLGDIVDFSQPQYDYETLLRQFVANPDSLTQDEYDFLREKIEEDIKSIDKEEYDALKEEVESNIKK